MDKLRPRCKLARLLQCFHSAFQTCLSVSFIGKLTPVELLKLCSENHCYSLRVFLNRFMHSCKAPLKTLIIRFFNVQDCFLTFDELWEFDARAAIQRSVFHQMDVKRCHSSVASSLIKILNSFLNGVH